MGGCFYNYYIFYLIIKISSTSAERLTIQEERLGSKKQEPYSIFRSIPEYIAMTLESIPLT
jgi:hypothetical protein